MIIASLIISISTAIAGFILNKGVVIVSYGFIVPLVLLLPRFFYYLDLKVKQTVNLNWVKRLDFFAFFVIILNAPASVYLHDLNFQYDRFLHFTAAFFGLIIFFLLWLPVIKIKGKEIKKIRFLLFVLIISFFGLFLWEGLQYSIDQVAGTDLFFDPSQIILRDVSEDIIFGLAGLILSLLYLNHNFNKITLSVWKQKK